MSELKLFGRTIHLRLNSPVSGAATEPSSKDKLLKNVEDDDASHMNTEDLSGPTTSSGKCDNSETPVPERVSSLLKTTSTEEKTLKKPDKILPCPRCDSMDTKFCYYNNYNVNQPRHFCKNCQRYWTAGGITRNLPVGAGRRKNKNSCVSCCHQVIVSEALQAAQLNGIYHRSLGNNDTVFTFGLDSSRCESMDSVLKVAEKVCFKDGIPRGGDFGNDHQNGSSSTASNSSEKKNNAGLVKPAIKNYQGFPSQVPCFPGPHWPFPWNPVQWSPAMHPPACSPSGFPVPFYAPPAYWGCTIPGSWNIPCVTFPSPPLPHCSCNTSPSLGKHSREGDILNPVKAVKDEPTKENNNSECRVLVPKKLRIDDPTEAAKSSIWTTLGIENEKRTNAINGKGPFKVFHSTNDNKNQAVKTSSLLEANPAALSRSRNFHEIT